MAALWLGMALAARAQDATVAFLGSENSGKDPRFDYLGPLVSGIILYDLSSSAGIALVDRTSLDAVLREQEISAGLGKGDAAKLGAILGASHIARAEYGVIGQEVSLTLSLVDAGTAQTYAFTDRGTDENLVHALAERLVKKLTGNDAQFRSGQRKRSLLSLKDVTPGSVSLYTALQNAEIYVDGAFAGFTSGDIRVPFKAENLEPGSHTLSVKLAGFGMVKLPEVEYREWSKAVELPPGKNVAVKADIRMFSDWYYEIRKVKELDFRLRAEAGKDVKEGAVETDFVDREGVSHPVVLTYRATRDQAGGSLSATLSVDGARKPLSLACATGKKAEAAADIGPLRLSAELNARGADAEYGLLVERTDIQADEWE
jgi:hypothetical protein